MKSSASSVSIDGNLVLGLDIGAASVGWALVAMNDGRPDALRASGTRSFEAGTEGDIAAGRDSSRAAERRQARLRRRKLARRRHRLTKLAKVLQEAGLLPPGELTSADASVAYFADLDRLLFSSDLRRDAPHVLPYLLRARALDEPLRPFELGRALYHLAQRRGFLSNRRERPKPAGAPQTDEEKEEGKVKEGIARLRDDMANSGARTLGEYLSRLNPEEERVRNRYLGRQMIAEEFEAIWAAQVRHHPGRLTDELRARVHRAIFHQRPLKSQRNLIGECDLERGCRRAPLACIAAQRVRLLQKVNDLEVTLPSGERRTLGAEERAILVEALEREGDMTFAGIRRLLKLPARNCRFNFEVEGEKGIIGNRTAQKLRSVFGDGRWEGMTPDQREQVVTEVRSMQKPDALARRGAKLWGLDGAAAERLAKVALEDGYCNLSLRALAKVLPLMESGMPYATARKQLYGDRPGPRPRASLPPLDLVLTVRNPAVARALTEVRKVVNAIVREHGRPDFIRVELARDLKRPRKDRQRIATQNASNRRDREAAARKLAAEAGISSPRRSDIEKWLLADECGWTCPYTGRQISVEALFGDHPQFDVEHIIPFHRCLDDSFMNKTLCDATENRANKRNRIPWEAYGHDPDKWHEIIARVKAFPGRSGRAKLERFQLQEVADLDGFTAQQLSDTRYASRLAVEYLGLLYGAGADGVDPERRRRVQASRGAVTAYLRDKWHLNSILGGGEKTRDDHRHHAIDAIVTALTTPAAIKRLSDAAASASVTGRDRFTPVEPPWEGFLPEVREAIFGMNVSHRVCRKVAAALHEETIYSKPIPDEEGRERFHVRKPLDKLSGQEVAEIVDPSVRERVVAKLEELGESNPAKAFAGRENHPVMRARDGREIPIHRVRVRTPVTAQRIGEGAYARHVKLGSNHHIEIVETTDRRGNPRWEGKVVSTYEAMRRLRQREPIVQRDHGPDRRFLFSLAGGEIIELDAEQDKRQLFVIRTISLTRGGRATVDFAAITDARKKVDIQAAGDWGRSDIDPLRRRNCRKVVVTPLGEVRRASD